MPHSRNNGRSKTEANNNDHSIIDGEDELGQAAEPEYIPPPEKPSVLELLKAQLAPFKPPGSDKESATFKAIKRSDLDRIANMSLKGVVDVNYEPRMTATKQRHGCLVTIDPATTARRLTLKARDLCSKGKSECRFSNARTKDQLAQLHALSPKIE